MTVVVLPLRREGTNRAGCIGPLSCWKSGFTKANASLSPVMTVGGLLGLLSLLQGECVLLYTTAHYLPVDFRGAEIAGQSEDQSHHHHGHCK